MDIKVNDKPLDFTLEKEGTLIEVVKAVEEWLAPSGIILTSLKIDGREYSLDEKDTWGKTPIDSVNLLEIQTESALQIRINNLETLANYFRIMATIVANEQNDHIKEIMAEYSYVRESLPGILEIPRSLAGNSLPHQLDSAVEAAGLTKGTVEEEGKEQVFTVINAILTRIEERLHEIEDPLKELYAASGRIEKSVDEISEVSVLLQTGKDKEAMVRVISFLDLSQKILRCLSYLLKKGIIAGDTPLTEEKTLYQFYTEMNTIMLELIKAFEASDSILIGDLLEYEISPKIRDLLDALKNLKTRE